MIIFAIALAVGFGMYALREWHKQREADQQPQESDQAYWVPYVTVQDLKIMSYAGLSMQQWQAMTAAERADLRWRAGPVD